MLEVLFSFNVLSSSPQVRTKYEDRNLLLHCTYIELQTIIEADRICKYILVLLLYYTQRYKS